LNRQSVSSSSIKSVGYDPDAEILKVEFHKSGIYQYFGVPTRVHEDLINAFSKGKYYTVYIKDAYSFRRIK
jgi:hypothetical protein